MNFPEVFQKSLSELSRLFGRALAKQNPVGGMFGGVNATLVRQFRMPGYPLVLITTEVLQEGEDLHTFCSRVVHYGITWTPSAMEQRTGRIDRIGSLTHRRLDGRTEPPPADELLQVYYPYLGDTVERLQVERVFERMNRFIRMIHRTAEEESDDSRIDTRREFLRTRRDLAQITERLESSFPVRSEHLEGKRFSVEKPDAGFEHMKKHLRDLNRELSKRIKVDWDDQDEEGVYSGTVFVDGSRLLVAEDPRLPGENGVRRQPFILFLRSSGISQSTLLHCTSPVGDISETIKRDLEFLDIVYFQAELKGAKLCMVPATDAETYTLSAEGDIIFAPDVTQLEEAIDLLVRVTVAADRTEREFLGAKDEPLARFAKDLRHEANHAAD